MDYMANYLYIRLTEQAVKLLGKWDVDRCNTLPTLLYRTPQKEVMNV